MGAPWSLRNALLSWNCKALQKVVETSGNRQAARKNLAQSLPPAFARSMTQPARETVASPSAPKDGKAALPEKRAKDRRSGVDRRMFPRPEGRRTGDGRREDDPTDD